MAKHKTSLDYREKLLLLKEATLSNNVPINNSDESDKETELPSLESRINNILKIVNNKHRRPNAMLFFVMYDIESNKVRYNVVKYLQKQGCTRIQKSIFLADLDTNKYSQIKEDLTQIQALYENHDSIIICPVSTEQINAMKVIGQKIDIDIIIHNKNTLFF